MTPKAQRIAIAEWCGWVTDAGYENSLRDNSFYGSCPSQNIKWKQCPDYLNDLNAIHEAENLIRRNQFHYVDYPRNLFNVISGTSPDRDGLGYFTFNFVHATASERCEALVRTIGKWQEDK